MIIYSAFVSEGFKLWVPGPGVLAIHAVDFGLGFCSRLLPGAIYNLFFDKVDSVRTTAYVAVLMVIFFIVLSLILEKFLLSIKSEDRKTALILLIFFLTGPSTFAIHMYYPGTFDMYWTFAAVLLFILLSKKQSTLFVFLPFVLCIMVYYASLISFIPFFVIIILYKISCCESQKEKRTLWGVLTFSLVVTIALGIYLAFFEVYNLKYTVDEFHKIYSAKGTDNFNYYDRSLFKNVGFEDDLHIYYEMLEGTNSKLVRLWTEVLYRIRITFSDLTLRDKSTIFAVILPAAAFIFSFLLNQIKENRQSGKKLKAFANFCMIVLPFFTVIISLMFSEDLVRWTAHAFVNLFSGFLYILYKEKEDVWCWVKNKLSKIPFSLIILYFIFYASVVYHPYYLGQ